MNEAIKRISIMYDSSTNTTRLKIVNRPPGMEKAALDFARKEWVNVPEGELFPDGCILQLVGRYEIRNTTNDI